MKQEDPTVRSESPGFSRGKKVNVRIIQGDARQLPLDDATVDLIVCSPPYWSLRSYTDGGEAYDGQIGAEPTPAEYVDNLIDCTREWMRVLKPTGSMWINLGDKYAGGGMGGHGGGQLNGRGMRQGIAREYLRGGDAQVRDKSLVGLPWRYALRCIDDLGLILRAEIIWAKPNSLPESVQDRVRRSHEQWFHLVKQPRYYSAIDHIRTPHANPGKNYGPGGAGANAMRARNTSINGGAAPYDGPNPLGALPGSVWEIPTEPLQVPAHLGIDHFAAFPMEWPRRIILGWSPSGICTTCGEGRRPVAEREQRTDVAPAGPKHMVRYSAKTGLGTAHLHTVTGEVCGCPDTSAPTRPAVVLDPFGGTGTTALVAHALGRDGISGDMSADYCRLATWRTTDPGQLAKAMGVPKPPKELDGQASALDLLTELDGGAA